MVTRLLILYSIFTIAIFPVLASSQDLSEDKCFSKASVSLEKYGPSQVAVEKECTDCEEGTHCCDHSNDCCNLLCSYFHFHALTHPKQNYFFIDRPYYSKNWNYVTGRESSFLQKFLRPPRHS